jgi:hypothetical protein
MAAKWRIIAQRHQRTVQALLFEIGRLRVQLGEEQPYGLLGGASFVAASEQMNIAKCAQCGRQIDPYTNTGRKRLYCGAKCRTRAWRARKWLNGNTEPSGAERRKRASVESASGDNV